MNILVRGARQLLTLRGPARSRRGAELRELGLIHDGAVLIQNGVVQEAGPSRRVENLHAARGAEEINATGRVVMPGFVDSHTHLVSGPSWLDEYEARLAGQPAEFLHFPDLKATFRSIQTSSARRVEAGASSHCGRHGPPRHHQRGSQDRLRRQRRGRDQDPARTGKAGSASARRVRHLPGDTLGRAAGSGGLPGMVLLADPAQGAPAQAGAIRGHRMRPAEFQSGGDAPVSAAAPRSWASC